MIIDRLENAHRYEPLNHGFKAGFDFLRSADWATLAPGRHEIDGDRVFALVGRETGRGRRKAKLEAHHVYVDLRYVIEGIDEFGWKFAPQCTQVAIPYDAGTDLVFFADKPDLWVPLAPKMLAIFFPEDAHAVLAGTGECNKVVVKIWVA